MPWFALIIPIVLGLACLYIYRHKLVWWEILLPVVVGLITIAIMKTVMLHSATSDIEYLSEYPTEARYYEDWDEWIDETCEDCTTDEDGNVSCTTYDCSYRDYHPQYWEIRTNTGRVISIDQQYFNKLTRLWSNKNFVDLHRDYYRNDGDMYRTKFDGKFEHIEPRTFKQTYENKAQSATNIFKFRELDNSELVGLYTYPKIYGEARQDNCLGCSVEDNLYLERYNAYIGRRLQIKMYVLVYQNKSVEIAERQKVFWKGGNMNELVVCVDKEGQWAKSFSWCDDKTIESEVNDIFIREIPFREKLNLLEAAAEKSWRRKDFHKDFDYIDVPLSGSQLIWIYAIVTVFTLLILTFGVKNDIEQNGSRN